MTAMSRQRLSMQRLSVQRLGCAALALLSLSGCNGTLKLLGLRHDARPEIAVRPLGGEDPADAGSATRQGREALQQGRTGAAIEQFQRALSSGEPIGPAANGMGVAYARLGQFEQAHRFFSEAIAVEPDNEKYRANLALLMRSPLLAQRHEADFAAPLISAAAIRAVVPAKPVAQTSLTRVSRGEVMLHTTGAPTARSGALPRTGALGSNLAGFKPLVRIEFSDAPAKPEAARAPDPADTPAPAPAAPEKPASRTVHFMADARGFKPLVRVELGQR